MTEPDTSGEGGLRINAVAELSGLGEHTIRAWERRYGVPKPARSAGRQRLYSREDVAALRRMNELARQGLSLAAAARTVLQERERGQLQAGAHAMPTADHLAASLLAFDEVAANETWTAALGAADVATVLETLAVPVLRDIGDRWHAGEASVAQEHFASGFIRTRLDALARQHTPSPGAPAALLACLPGDWHELGLLMLHVLLRYRGVRTVYLGQSVPADDIVRAAAELQPAVLAVHGSESDAREELVWLATRLAEAAPGMHVLCGGPPFEGGAVPVEGVQPGGATIGEAATRIEHLVREDNS